MNQWLQTAEGSALAVAVLLGLLCGTLGTFVVTRRMALTGDMLSHAVLPGVVAGIVWQRNPVVALIAAIIAGMFGTAVMHALQKTTRLKIDACLGIVLSVFFALGIAFISVWQPSGVQAYLYGQAAAIDRRDLILLATITLVSLSLIAMWFRPLHVTSFDAGFARLLGYPVVWLDRMFFFLLAAAIVVAMQAVGVVLVSSMLITPAVAAQRLSHRFGRVLLSSCAIGAIGACIGVKASASQQSWPTGPMMALAVTGCFILVSWFAPRDGTLSRFLRKRAMRRKIERENLLKSVFRVQEQERFRYDAVPMIELAQLTGMPLGQLERRARLLVSHGDAVWTGGRSGIRFTEEGKRRAEEIVRNHRLWERYLTERAAYAADHVHDDAERVEHWIDEEKVRRLEESLGFPEQDPHGKKIPAVGRQEKEDAR